MRGGIVNEFLLNFPGDVFVGVSPPKRPCMRSDTESPERGAAPARSVGGDSGSDRGHQRDALTRGTLGNHHPQNPSLSANTEDAEQSAAEEQSENVKLRNKVKKCAETKKISVGNHTEETDISVVKNPEKAGHRNSDLPIDTIEQVKSARHSGDKTDAALIDFWDDYCDDYKYQLRNRKVKGRHSDKTTFTKGKVAKRTNATSKRERSKKQKGKMGGVFGSNSKAGDKNVADTDAEQRSQFYVNDTNTIHAPRETETNTDERGTVRNEPGVERRQATEEGGSGGSMLQLDPGQLFQRASGGAYSLGATLCPDAEANRTHPTDVISFVDETAKRTGSRALQNPSEAEIRKVDDELEKNASVEKFEDGSQAIVDIACDALELNACLEPEPLSPIPEAESEASPEDSNCEAAPPHPSVMPAASPRCELAQPPGVGDLSPADVCFAQQPPQHSHSHSATDDTFHRLDTQTHMNSPEFTKASNAGEEDGSVRAECTSCHAKDKRKSATQGNKTNRAYNSGNDAGVTQPGSSTRGNGVKLFESQTTEDTEEQSKMEEPTEQTDPQMAEECGNNQEKEAPDRMDTQTGDEEADKNTNDTTIATQEPTSSDNASRSGSSGHADSEQTHGKDNAKPGKDSVETAQGDEDVESLTEDTVDVMDGKGKKKSGLSLRSIGSTIRSALKGKSSKQKEDLPSVGGLGDAALSIGKRLASTPIDSDNQEKHPENGTLAPGSAADSVQASPAKHQAEINVVSPNHQEQKAPPDDEMAPGATRGQKRPPVSASAWARLAEAGAQKAAGAPGTSDSDASGTSSSGSLSSAGSEESLGEFVAVSWHTYCCAV